MTPVERDISSSLVVDDVVVVDWFIPEESEEMT